MTDIHRLELSAGGYRWCKWNDVMACLKKDHVTHLQRFGRTVAIRPLRVDGKRIWKLDIAFDGITNRSLDSLYANDYDGRVDLIRFVTNWLNEDKCLWVPGEDVAIEANQNTRDGTVLAVDGKKVLVEYEMPGTTGGRITSSLLEFEDVGGNLINRRSRPHGNLPRFWRKALQNGVAENYWIGKGQRRHMGSYPFPTAD